MLDLAQIIMQLIVLYKSRITVSLSVLCEFLARKQKAQKPQN